MFKKTLVAATILGMSSTAMGAIVVTANIGVPTPQRVTTDPAFSSGTITTTNAAEYLAGNTFSLAFSHDVDATQVFATTAIAATCAGANVDMSVAFAGYQAATKTATYTVQTIGSGGTAGCVTIFPAVLFDGAVVAAADTVTVNVTTSKGFGATETMAAPAQMINVAATQFAVTAAAGSEADGAALNGTIDVSKARYEFTTGALDSVTLNLTDSYAAVGTHAILQATSTMTVTGDFSWAAVTSTAGVTTYPGVSVTNGAGGNKGAVTKTATSVSWIATTAGTYVLTLTPQAKAKAVVLPKTPFALSTNITYKRVAADATVLSGVVATVAGAWTLNGANITAYGIPNGASADSFLWISNTGTEEGAISVDVTCDGVTTAGISGGTAVAKTNTRIAALVQAGVDAAGTCGASSRYDAAITVNAPVANITVNAGYKVTAADGATDRLTLETSDSLN